MSAVDTGTENLKVVRQNGEGHRGRKHYRHKMEEENEGVLGDQVQVVVEEEGAGGDILENEAVLAFVAETGCPIYSGERIKPDDLSCLLLAPDEVDADKVCCRVPPSCPSIGWWLFIVSLDHIDPDDLSYDELGKWGRPSGRRHFFLKTEDTIKRLPGRDKEPLEWDYCVRWNRYTHPGTDGVNKFFKNTFLAFNNTNDLLGPYAIVQYIAEVDPSALRRLPHANSKNDKSMQRTKPSALKHAKTLLLTQTPKQVMETMLSGATGEVDPSDLPKDVSQIRSLISSARNRSSREAMAKSGRLYHSTPAADNASEASFSSPTPTPKQTGRGRPTGNAALERLQMQVLQAEKRKHEVEVDKLEVEKEKLETESQMIKMGEEKLRLEIDVLKAKKFKLDVELAKMGRSEDGNVVIVEDGGTMDYEREEEYHQ